MGHTKAKVKIYGSSGAEEIELTVDTGSTYSWIPEKLLMRLGVEPKWTENFRTIEGRIVPRSTGQADVEYAGKRVTSMVVFARGGDASVLGVHALEGLGLEVDPITKQLKKAEALLAL
jgi:predicted aspartyl protease